MKKTRKGRQKPTVWITRPYVAKRTKEADEAIELYAESGQEALEWQKKQIKAILAVDKNGKYIHRKYGFSVPRRNGKTEIFLMRERYALEHGEIVHHTAHLTATSSDAARRLAENLVMSGYVEVTKRNKGTVYDKHFLYKKQFGMESITLLREGGGTVSFRTRTSRAGLGQKCDVLIIDEAQEYTTEQENTLKFLVSDSENRQIIMAGTPPTAISAGTVFKQFRKDVMNGVAVYSGWAEWSVLEMTDMRDKDAWYQTNPSIGYVFGEDAIELEIGSDQVDFNIQRLGLWIVYNQAAAISKKIWERTELNDRPDITGKLFVGIKFGSTGNNTAVSVACKTKGGKVFVSVYDCKNRYIGNEWIIDFIRGTKSIEKVIIDGKVGVGPLTDRMKEEQFGKPVVLSGTEYLVAISAFEQAVFADGVVHLPQPDLDEIVTNCEKKPYGNSGGFVYRPLITEPDICLMESIILAFYGCISAKEKRVQKIGY